MQNFQKYLPSKKFMTVILFIVVIIVLFFTFKTVISFIKNKKNTQGNLVQVTVGGIIQKDSNNNGFADWEEYLWGLDPLKNGQKNKEYILSKKESLRKNGIITNLDDSNSINQNEMLSRQFFATLISLQQTGELNEGTINSLAEAIGENIEPFVFDNAYSIQMLDVQSDSVLSNENYRKNLTNIINKYADKDLGSELVLISQGLGGQDQQAIFAINNVIDSYKSFGAELTKIPVPQSLAHTHLSLANNYQKTAVSIEGMIGMLEDPIVGMKSLLTYKKYSDDLVSDLQELTNSLQ